MNGRRAKFAQRAQMFGCAVSFVLREMIVRELRVEFAHQAVTRHFGKNGRGRDGQRERVAVNDALLWNRNVLENERVEQQRGGRGRKLCERAIHGEMRRVQDIDFVNFALRGRTNCIRDGDFANWLE